MNDVQTKTKLIEVALPLEAISKASAKEKSIRLGNPSTIHLWWSRKPLAACRAVLFASLVDDPSAHPDMFPTDEAQAQERQRLFRLIERLVEWEAATDETVLGEARAEIAASCGSEPPPVMDPFCGGGSIPLEAQRLGLEAHGSDLNPVAVMITRALVEIPARFNGLPPRNPTAAEQQASTVGWTGAAGLAVDVQHYGRWMRDRAHAAIGKHYPTAVLPDGRSSRVIAWKWARTMTCPNPACGARMPLLSGFHLSKKQGREAWIEPSVDRATKRVSFRVVHGAGNVPEPTVTRNGAVCLVCEAPVKLSAIREAGKQGQLGMQMLAIVAESDDGRAYLDAREDHCRAAEDVAPENVPITDLPEKALSFRVQAYGMDQHWKLYTPRQLLALTTMCDLVAETRDRVLRDAQAAGMEDGTRLVAGGDGAEAYADAVATYVAFAIDRLSDRLSTLCTWDAGSPKSSNTTSLRNTFARQALQMTWDFAEGNPFSEKAGNLVSYVDLIAEVIRRSPSAGTAGFATQHDAMTAHAATPALVSTDPPYYDNIGYADLSDYFYVWMRRSLAEIHPVELGTMLVPKASELVATPHRFEGSRDKAKTFFESGIREAVGHMRSVQHRGFPMTIYYAFKQQDGGGDAGSASTGWEAFLQGVVDAGVQITGTWPIRTEMSSRNVARGTNALASSIVLVCRPLSKLAGIATRSDFVNALRQEMPSALQAMEQGFIAPADVPQSAIGPGMSVFTRYQKVVEANGDRMTVRTALELINQVLDEHLYEGDAELDAESRWAVRWYEQHGYLEGEFGVADQMARAQNVAVANLAQTGILEHGRGKVRLFAPAEYPEEWNPRSDDNVPAWEGLHQLAKAWDGGGEVAAAELIAMLDGRSDPVPDLARRMFALAEKRGMASDAVTFNAIVAAWPRLRQLAAGSGGVRANEQIGMEV